MPQGKHYDKTLCFTFSGLSALKCAESSGAEIRA